MNRALWLLLWLRFRSWVRRLARSAGSPRGAIFLVVGLLFFGLMVGPQIALRFQKSANPHIQAEFIEHTRELGPLLLFAYCVLTVLFASSEQGISFTPAEVQFLFSGPFSRRQVLLYKILANSLIAAAYSLFMTLFFVAYAYARPLAAYPGLLLTLWFIQFFSLAVSLLINTIGARAVSRPRQLLVLLLIGLAVWAAVRVGGDALAHGPSEGLKRLAENEVVRILLTPMRWFVETFTAETLWPDFVIGAARCLAVLAGLLLIIFLLDAQYLEAAAAASERSYARLQRVRSGGAVAAAIATGRPRFSLPSLPRWGGVGPLAWRQLTTAVRSLRPVVVFLVIFFIIVGGSRLALGNAGDDEFLPGSWFIGSMVLGMSVAMLTPLLTFDFRGDIDRLDVLKALPLPAWRIALGQLLAPTLILSAVQMIVIGLVQALWGHVEALLVGVAMFALPFNFLSIGMENLMFLWFPTRLVTTPGDFQMMGRQMMMMTVKVLALGVVIVPTVLIAVTVGLLAQWLLNVAPEPPAMVAGCVVMTALAAGVVPLVASAFRRFDVARDTPP